MSKWLVMLVGGGCLFFACTVPTLEELNERWGTVPRVGTVAEFDPTGETPALPFPIDLLFLGSEDGTMNLPVADATDYSDPQVQMNTLDGFSTVIPMEVSFSGRVREETLIAGDTLRVFEVEKSSAYLAISSIVSELEPLTDYRVERSERESPLLNEAGEQKTGEEGEPLWETRHGLTVVPVVPLKPGTSYLVVVGTGILDEAGHALEPSLIYGMCKGGSPLVDRFGHTTVPVALDDESAAMLEQLRALVNSYEILLGLQAGIGSGSVALAWTFTTQFVHPMLEHIAVNSVGANHILAPMVGPLGTPLTTEAFSTEAFKLKGNADVYAGTIEVPYYLNEREPTAWDNFWRGALGNHATVHYERLTGAGPVLESTQTIPFLLTVPHGMDTPEGGWPVTIFQHDLTQNRFNALAVADALASARQAVIAIDLPLHGVNKYKSYDLSSGAADPTSGPNPLYPFSADAPAAFASCGTCAEGATPDPACGAECGVGLCMNAAGGLYRNHPAFAAISGSLRERMMGLDSDQDGEINGSGANFLNFLQGLNLRDNLRQGAADLLVLRRTILDMELLNSEQVSFLGHGVGASVGVLFLAEAEKAGLKVSAGVLASPLSGIGRALEGSYLIGPLLKGGLEMIAGVAEGSASYEQFFMAFQTALDAGDPINYGAEVESPVLMFEVVGDGHAYPPDMYFPVDGGTRWPTAGSSALARQMGLRAVTVTPPPQEERLGVVVRFSKGSHTSLLDPSGAEFCSAPACDASEADTAAFAQCAGPFAAVTTAMQTQMVSFIGSGGTHVQVEKSVNLNGTSVEVLAEGE